MQKKITRTIEEDIIICDSCGKEINTDGLVSRCFICYKDICLSCRNTITINSAMTFFICPECKKSLTMQQLEDKINEEN